MSSASTSYATFMAESNRIEGIHRPPTEQEVEALATFVSRTTITQADLVTLVRVFQPDAELRDQTGMNVVVGTHRPPPGGPAIPAELDCILDTVMHGAHPHLVHHAYETLYPFTAGNGRSGRALWLWGMQRYSESGYQRALRIGFLRSWYYQSLELGRLTACDCGVSASTSPVSARQ
jgi:hypothetical protein